jgi:site-specific recombinase XerD
MDQLPVIYNPSQQDVIPVEVPKLEHILAGRLAPSSIAMYKRDVKAYTDYAASHNMLWIDPKTLVSWRDELALDGDMSPNTINRMIAAVKRIIREMAAREMITEEESIKFDRVHGVKVKSLKNRLKKHARTRITKEDMRRLCESPDKTTLIGLRDKALLAVLASSGIRASEAATLTVEQIEKHEKGYTLKVCGKTDTEYRDAHLSVEAYQCVQEWIEQRPIKSSYIFTAFNTRGVLPLDNPVSEVTVWNIVQRYADQCEIPNIKPHDFRRFLGTQLAAVDIRKAQKALGHQSIETTARHYVLDELEVGLTDNLY